MSNRHDTRSKTTGRWMKVDVSSTPLADDSAFPTFSKEGFEVGAPSDVHDSPYELVSADRNVVQRPQAPAVLDNLGVGGSPLRARNPAMVSSQDADHTIYGQQGAVLRSAASRGARDRISGTDVEADPTRRLTGAE